MEIKTQRSIYSSGNFYKYTDDLINSDVSNMRQELNELNSSLEQMKASFQDGCNTIYNAIVAKGVTPSSNSPDDIATAINSIATDVKHSVYAKAQETGGGTRYMYAYLYVDGKQVGSAFKEFSRSDASTKIATTATVSV